MGSCQIHCQCRGRLQRLADWLDRNGTQRFGYSSIPNISALGLADLPIASHINAVVAWSFMLLGISVLFGIVRATGQVLVPLFIQTLSLLVVRFTLTAVLLDRWQAEAIWWSFGDVSNNAEALTRMSPAMLATFGGR